MVILNQVTQCGMNVKIINVDQSVFILNQVTQCGVNVIMISVEYNILCGTAL